MVTELVQSALANSRAASTLAAYESGWNSYTRVCRLFKMKALPITEARLISYAVLTHDKLDLLSNTIRNYCIAIACLQGLDDPRKSGNLLNLVLDGCRRQDVNGGYEKRLRLGIDGEHLVTLIKSLDLTDFRAARFAAYAVTSYFGGFRANELVKAKSGVRCRWSDFVFDPPGSNGKYFFLTQRLSKALPFGPSISIAVLITRCVTCPFKVVHIYRSFFDPTQVRPNMPAFMNLNGKPYTYKQALLDSRYFLGRIGLREEHFGTQSFRIGMASEAGRLDMEDSVIQLLGRWRSDSFLLYKRTAPEKLAQYAYQLRGKGG